MRNPLVVLCASALAVVCTAMPALAGRGLDEPPGLAKIVKAAPKAELEKALADVNGVERCKDALKSSDLRGLECRAVAAAGLVHRRPLATPADVDARAAVFADLARAAASVSTWAPLTPPPGLARARFEAHRAISAALMIVYDDLVGARATLPAAAQWLGASPSPKDSACTAVQRSVELGVGGEASLEERGAAQSLLTSHKCFLDESRLQADLRPGRALKDSADAATIAKATSSVAAIQQYAQSRSVDTARCEKHLDAGGKPKDKAKLEECACGAVARWKLPAPKSAVTATIPVAGSASVVLDVAPAGAVTKCALAGR